jgi:hypothetical protein
MEINKRLESTVTTATQDQIDALPATQPSTQMVYGTVTEQINQHHALAEQAGGVAIHHAIQAGELLAEMKSRLKHGQWTAYLEANFEGSVRTAQGYMRLATNRGQIAQASSIEGALKALAAPRANTQEPADLPTRDQPAEMTPTQRMVFRAWLRAARPVLRRWMPDVRDQLDREPDAEDGKMAMPHAFFAEMAELGDALPTATPGTL